MGNKRQLFHNQRVSDWLAERRKEVIGEVNREQIQTLLSANLDDYCRRLASRYAVSAPNIRGDDERKYARPNGATISFYFPYDGTEELLDCQPSEFDFNAPYLEITSSNEVVLTFSATNDSKALQSQIDSELARFNKWLTRLQKDIAGFNEGAVFQMAKSQAEARIQKHKGNQDLLGGMGFRVAE